MYYCVEAIEIKYSEKGALVGPHQPAEFKAGHDAISLDIPMEGLSIQGWKITPQIFPVVSSCVHHIHPTFLASLVTTSGDQEAGGQL